MTPRKNDIQRIIRNCDVLQKKLDECAKLFQVNLDMLSALASGNAPSPNGFTLPTNHIEAEILKALASCAAVGVHTVPRPWLAVVALINPRTSPYRNALARLTKENLIRRAGPGSVSLSENVRGSIAPYPVPLEAAELVRRASTFFRKYEADLLSSLFALSSDHEWITRQQLAEHAGQSVDSSAFRERLSQLREGGFVDFGLLSTVRLSLHWFTWSTAPLVEPA
jgi:hypothetical protein